MASDRPRSITPPGRGGRPAPRSRRSRGVSDEAAVPPHERFLRLERARVEREWARYEGTAQRDLFRELRERYLRRHAREADWVLDVGAGPGRFTLELGGPRSVRVALDLAVRMLEVHRERAEARGLPVQGQLEWVRGDASHPPFRAGTFGEVALLGNTLGFEGRAGPALLDAVEELVRPGGVLLVEAAPGPGERSRYLARLPAGTVRRLFAAPPRAVIPRIEKEGFREVPLRHRTRSFRRWPADELLGRWRSRGWVPREVLAIAPALGADAARVSAVAEDPRAWSHLLEVEEALGHDPRHWPRAAAILLSVVRPP